MKSRPGASSVSVLMVLSIALMLAGCGLINLGDDYPTVSLDEVVSGELTDDSPMDPPYEYYYEGYHINLEDGVTYEVELWSLDGIWIGFSYYPRDGVELEVVETYDHDTATFVSASSGKKYIDVWVSATNTDWQLNGYSASYQFVVREQ